ncbi:MAG: F0F1 ATP synthase subunit delta [Zoogloeaceae bacterium]|jgi:F-type H+-transporting ATPase subunit delta|nr:F0F1 ATP synthase subunit delta [Zoogloeaceae bacterium]
MSETVTVARPYAEAAFRAAKEGGALDAWNAGLQQLALAAHDERVADLIDDPALSVERVAGFFVALSGKAGERPDFGNFVHVLAENGRLTLLPEIAGLFAAQRSAEEGVREATVTSAFPLSKADLEALLPRLEAHFKTKLTPSVTVDADLIGGVRVEVGDQVLDASVRGKLDAMAIALRN